MAQYKTGPGSHFGSAARTFTTTITPSEMSFGSNKSSAVKEKEGKVPRDLNGCMNCRVRRKKCGGPMRPGLSDDACENCHRLQFLCLGYPGLQPAWAKSDIPGEKHSMRYRELEAEMKLWTKTVKSKAPHETLDLSKYLRPDISPYLTREELIAHEERVRLSEGSSRLSTSKPAPILNTPSASETGIVRQRSASISTEGQASSRRRSYTSQERIVGEPTKRRGSNGGIFSSYLNVFHSRSTKSSQQSTSKPPVTIPPKHRASQTNQVSQQSTLVVPAISVHEHVASGPAPSNHIAYSPAPVWHGSDESLLYPSPYAAPNAYSSGTSEYSSTSRESTPPHARQRTVSSPHTTSAYTSKPDYPPSNHTPLYVSSQGLPCTLLGQNDYPGFYQYPNDPTYSFLASHPAPTDSFMPMSDATGSYSHHPKW